jgi:hypothetical protein
LTNANVWSHDGQWIVYDVRSDPAGAVFDGTRIERVHVETGEIQTLYQSGRGACCGVATCSPVGDRVAFILGPEDPTPDWQYAAYRRRGVIVNPRRPGTIEGLDACNVTPPFTRGALRGGSHVHVFSGDGQWVSFTYEDHVLATSDGQATDADVNQRNVGVAAPFGPVRPPPSHPRNHDGAYFCVLVTKTVSRPAAGSDEISRACEDAWIGTNGYRRADGRWQTRALAFLGEVVDNAGKTFHELFVVDVPDDVTQPGDGPLEGTRTRRPAPPAGALQRRLTFTADCHYPGVQGPRHWPRSSPDGSQIAFLMRDQGGLVQIWSISPCGGAPRQITSDLGNVASAFTWDPRGARIAYVAEGSIMTVEVASGRTSQLTSRVGSADGPRPEACVFSPGGGRIAYVRPVAGPAGRFNQVFMVEA